MVRRERDGGVRTGDPAALAGAYLRALCDPKAGAAFLALHTADAPVRHPGGLRAAAEIDAVAFAGAHRDLGADGGGGRPAYGPPQILPSPEGANAADSVLWTRVVESHTQRSLTVAFGISRVGGRAEDTRVRWCTLADRVQPWSHAQGLLQSLADYPWMRDAGPAPARALLDAAYYRHYWRPPLRFTTLPDARFGCHMSTACCRHDFEIPLPAEAQLLIDAMPWETLQPRLAGTQLPVRSDGRLQLKALDETCRFLGARRQCLIHEALGQQPFGPCAVFPFAFAETPEGMAVSLSPICGSVRQGLGPPVAERELDLRERLQQSHPRRTDAFRLAPGLEVPWESFRDIEKALCDCVAAEGISMRRRLYAGVRLLAALKTGAPVETAQWLEEPLPTLSTELRAALRAMLERVLAWDRATLRRLPPTLPATLQSVEIHEAALLARLLHNVMYSKAFSYPYDLTTGFNLVILLYVLALAMQEAAQGPLHEAMWQELGSLGVHGMLKGMVPEEGADGFRILMGSGEFGAWALAL